jgi:hypothetical protein
MQVPPEDQSRFQDFLEEVAYHYWPEADNPAYDLFLK